MATTSSPVPFLLSAATYTPTDRTEIKVQAEPTFIHPNRKSGSRNSGKNLQEIRRLHAYIIKQGQLHNPTAVSDLVVEYSQVGTLESVEDALKVFNMCVNIRGNSNGYTSYLYNSLINGHSVAGLYSEAVSLYIQMVSDGVEPDNYTFPFVLSACAKSLRLFEGIQFHGSVVKMGLQDNVFVSNSLIYLYGECGEIDKGRQVFDEMCERNVVSWTSLICGHARRDRPKEAVSLFFEMVDEGIRPNAVTTVCVISACAKLQDLDLGEKVCTCVGELGLELNSIMVNALVDMYMKCGAVDKAKRLFDECVDRNLVLYNTVITNYVRLGKAEETLCLLREMLERGPLPDRVTILSSIAASAEWGHLDLGKQCHGYILRNRLENWDNVANAIIDMYMKCSKQEWACRVLNQMANKTVVSWNSLIAGFVRNGEIESARKMFNKMPERDLISWNTMIGSLVQESLFLDAIELFRAMQSGGIKADKVTLASIASACGYLGALDLAKWTYNFIQKSGIHCDMQLTTALVDMFARCGDSQSAMKIFRSMQKRDITAWTAAIGAMSMEGNAKHAIELFHEMLSQGIKPDNAAFAGVLTACSHGGLVQEGMELFRSMKKNHGLTPQIVHYGCVVDLLGRAGLLKEALDLIDDMPMEPNDAIWCAFLAACRKHKNEMMATYAAKMMSYSTSDKTGAHVLLSNIYASAGKWDDVAKVRTYLKEKGLRKVPGSSSIEVNGTVYEFTSGDECHLGNSLTDSMLNEINSRLRDAGYVPDLTNVLLDIDKQEKELNLSRHSEKLAIAFGLISSTRGTPIRVVKNLRMCSDCHSFAKMVSKEYDREIVVRDNNRFHFFRQGMCSCNDYW